MEQALVQLCLCWRMGGARWKETWRKQKAVTVGEWKKGRLFIFKKFRECGFNTLQVKEIYSCG